MLTQWSCNFKDSRHDLWLFHSTGTPAKIKVPSYNGLQFNHFFNVQKYPVSQSYLTISIYILAISFIFAQVAINSLNFPFQGKFIASSYCHWNKDKKKEVLTCVSFLVKNKIRH